MPRTITLTKRLITATPDGHTTETIHGPVHAELVSDNGHEIEALVTVDGRELTVHTNWNCALGYALDLG